MQGVQADLSSACAYQNRPPIAICALHRTPASTDGSDGLTLLKQCLVKVTVAYGDYIPIHKDCPACPVLFSEEELRRHEKEFEGIVYMEEFRDSDLQIGNAKKHGHLVSRDGSLSLENFDAAKTKAEGLLVSFFKGQG